MPKHLVLPLLLVFCILSSCTHQYYAPNSLHLSSIKSKGELDLHGGLIFSNDFDGVEAQAAYSPVNHGLLYLHHFAVKSSPENVQHGMGWQTELGVGTYFPLSSIASLTLSGFHGLGRVKNVYNDAGAFSDLKFNKSSAQLGVMLEEKYFRIGIGARINHLNYRSGSIDFQIPEDELESIMAIEEDAPILFPEFGFQVGTGYGPIWLNAHFNYSQTNSRYHFAPRTMGLSMLFQLDYFWREKTSTPITE
ncbi:MAG: hypothetical protein R2792_08350 [Saprospiraceae bacterium]